MIFLKISQPLDLNCHIHLEVNRKMKLWNVFMALAFIGVSKSVFLNSLKDFSFLEDQRDEKLNFLKNALGYLSLG